MRLDELADRLKALDLPAGLEADLRPFVQVRLTREGLAPMYRAEVDQIAGNFPVRVVDIRVTAPEATESQAAEAEPHVRLAEIEPEDLFRQAFERAHGRLPDPAHIEAFHGAAAAALGEV